MILGLSIAGLAVFSLLCLYGLIGLGSASLLDFRAGVRTRQPIVLLPFIGWAVSAVMLSWTASFGLAPIAGVLAILLLLLVSGVLRWFSSQRSGNRASAGAAPLWSKVWPLLPIAILASAAGVVGLLPAVSPNGTFGYVELLGPDAIGYAISGQAIARGLSVGQVADSIAGMFNDVPLALIVSPITAAVNQLASFTTQVQGEFLIGPGRLGWASTQGLLVQVLGFQRTWLVQGVMGSTSVAIIVLLGASVCPATRFRALRIAMFAMCVAGSPTLLYAWAQGGSGQIWILPALFAFMLGAAGFFGNSINVGIVALSVATMLCSYMDALVLAVMVAGVLVTLQTTRLSNLPGLGKRLTLGIALGLLLYLPGAARLPEFLSRSVDAAQGEWQVPSDFSVLSVLGLSPSFRPAELVVSQVEIGQTGVWLLMPVLLVVAAAISVRLISHRKLGRWSSVLLGSLVVIAAVFFLTQIRGGGTNYQLFKTVVGLLPSILGAVFLCDYGVLKGMIRWRGRRARFLVQYGNVMLLALGTVFVLIVWNNTASWIVEYRKSADYSASALNPLSYSDDSVKLLDKYAFVSPRIDLQTWALGTIGDLFLLNRSGIERLTLEDTTRELALLFPNLPNSGTADWVPNRNPNPDPHYIPGFTVVPLESSASLARDLSAPDICVLAGVAWARMGYPAMLDCDPADLLVDSVFFGWTGSNNSDYAKCPRNSMGWQGSMVITSDFPKMNADLFTTGGVDGAIQIVQEPDGSLGVVQSGSTETRTVLGYRSSFGTTVLTWKVSGSEFEAALNGRRTALQLNGPIACSRLAWLGADESKWNPLAVTIVTGARVEPLS